MRGKTLFKLMLILFFSSAIVYAQQTTELTINILDTDITHITIEIKNPEKFEELKSVLEAPAIKDIYNQKLSAVFGEIKNLKLYAEAQSFIIEFDSNLAEQKNEKWTVDKKEFQGNLDKISVLKITLPENVKLADSNPEPDKILGNALIWNNVDFVPEINYEKRTAISYKLFFAAILLVLLAVMFGFKKLKRKEQ